MNRKVILTADSTCDLSKELAVKYKVDIIPIGIIVEDKAYRDGIDISVNTIFDIYSEKGILPTTAAIGIAEYSDIFKKHIDDGYDVIHFSLSSTISSSYNNARLAAEELAGAYVVDTLNLSSGSGILISKAAEMVEKEHTAEQIFNAVNEMISKVDCSFVLDTLSFLHKGGRCSGLMALGANLLKLKPCIEVKSDGSMDVGKKFRGSLNVVLPQYIENRLSGQTGLDLERIFITHSTLDDNSIVDMVKKEIKKYAKFKSVEECLAGATISSHCGPNTLGIIFMKK